MKRFDFADAAKAIAIYFVIVGHAVSSRTEVFRFIFAFHMPFFFFISGYCFSEKSFAAGLGTFVKKRAKKMLVPYAVFAVIGFGIMLVFDSWKPGLSPFDFAMKYVYYTQPPALGQTWFLVALLVASVLFYTAYRVASCFRGKARLLVYGMAMLLFAFVGSVICQIVNIPVFGRLPWKIDTALTAVVFMMAGYAVKKTGFPEKPGLFFRAVLTVLLPVVVWFVSVKKNRYVNICDCIYGNIVYYYIGAIAGCLWVCLLGKWAEPVGWLCRLGKNSLPVFGIHSFVLWAWIRVYCKTITHVDEQHPAVSVFTLLIIPVLTYACSVLFVPVYNKIMQCLKRETGTRPGDS